MSSVSKKNVLFCLMFSAVAVLFTSLYFFRIISTLDLYLSAIYVCYFVGLALLHMGKYNREADKINSSLASFVFGISFFIASTTMLIYGLVTGMITLF